MSIVIKYFVAPALLLTSPVAMAVPEPERETEWPEQWVKGPAKLCYGGVILALKEGEKGRFTTYEPFHPFTIIFGDPPKSSEIEISGNIYSVMWPGNERDAKKMTGTNLYANSNVKSRDTSSGYEGALLLEPKYKTQLTMRSELEGREGMPTNEELSVQKDLPYGGQDVLQFLSISYTEGQEKGADKLAQRFEMQTKSQKDCTGPEWPLKIGKPKN